MFKLSQVGIFGAVFVLAASLLFCDLFAVRIQAQAKLTYPELNTALKTKLPNRAFSNKTQLLNWLIEQIRRRKVDKPLTQDREDDLRQAGATDELISAVRANTPLSLPNPPVTGPVDLGELLSRVLTLIKPEYTTEALQAKTTGEVRLSLELDEQGRVTAATQVAGLPNGLTERAIAAARQSTFKPATRDGKPARGTGTITYTFRINLNIAGALAAADALRAKRDCDGAIAEYAKVIGADAKNARAFFGRGICYLIKADYDKALSDAESAAKTDPNDPEMVFTLGVARDFKGDYASGAAAYRKVLSLQPAYDKQVVFQCLYLDRPGMTPEQLHSEAKSMINSCNQAIRATNDHLTPLLIFKRGIANRVRGDYEKAIEDFESVSRSNPGLGGVNTQLVIVYNRRGLEAFNKKDNKQAIEDITRAIQADPRNPTPYVNRCAVYLYVRNYDRAISDCSEAIRLSTKSAMAFVHRGRAYELKNNLQGAVNDYKTALQMDPQNTTARDHLERLRSKVPSLKDD